MHKIRYDSENLDEIRGRTRVTSIFTRLANAIDKDIRVCIPHGVSRSKMMESEYGFYIYIWSDSMPSDDDRCTPPYEIWGIDCRDKNTFCRDSAFIFTGNGVDIADGHFSVAKLEDNKHLYIFCDIVHTGSDIEHAVLNRLVDEVISIVTCE